MNDLLSEDAAWALLAPHLRLIGDCLREGVDRFNAEREHAGPVSTRSRASLVHDYAAEAAERAFDGTDGVELVRDHGFLVIVVDQRVLIRFKKLTNRLETRGIRTHQAQLWDAQEPLPGMPPVTHLVAGYVLGDLGDLDRLVLVCARYGRRLWTIDLDDDAGGLADVVPLPGPEEHEPGHAVVRSARREEGQEGDEADRNS